MNSLEIDSALVKLRGALVKTEVSRANLALQAAADKIAMQLPGSPPLKVEEFLPEIRALRIRLERHTAALNGCILSLKQVVDSFTK